LCFLIIFFFFLAENLALKLDSMIDKFPGVNDPNKLKVLVTDAAASMKKAGSVDSNRVYEANVCIDHVLNTSLCAAEKRCEYVSDLFETCKKLAARTHQSTNDWLYIKKKCAEKEIDPIKITQPVTTRWNSNCMMLESLEKMKVALLAIRIDDHAKEHLRDLMPDPHQFEVIKYLCRFLKKLRNFSEQWSSEKHVSIAGVLGDLYSIKLYTDQCILKLSSRFPEVTEFMTAFLEELQMHNSKVQRLRNLGLENKLYRIADYLHPFYKGFVQRRATLANGQNAFEHTEQYLIDKHPTTAR
jgi:hypothetical protein